MPDPRHSTQPGDLLKAEEAAAILDVDVSTILRFMRRGELAHVEITSRAKRIRRDVLEAFIASRERGGTPGAIAAFPAPVQSDYWQPPTRKGASR